MTITNSGGAPLAVSGFTFGGADPGDFLIGSDNCRMPINAGQSCQLTVRFAPQGLGAGTAALEIQSNDAGSPVTITLTGTGGAAPQGPQGIQWTQGPQGPQGPAGRNGNPGPRGPAGTVELVTCKTVTTTVKTRGHKRKTSRQKCTARLVSGGVIPTLKGSAIHATISRGRTVYATGTTVSIGNGKSQLLLSDRRRFQPGSYTLTLSGRRGRHWSTRRVPITIK